MTKTGRTVRLLPSLFQHLDVLFGQCCVKPCISGGPLEVGALDELQGNLFIEHMEYRMHSWYM